MTPLGDGGLPVGLVGVAEYEPVRFQVGPGDRLMLYSDGLVEAHNPAGEIFSEERLLDLVRAHADASTETLLERIDATVRGWHGSESLEDDLSILVLERMPGPVEEEAPLQRPVRETTGAAA